MKQSTHWYLLQIVMLFLVGIGIPSFVLWKNVFPSFSYRLGEVGVFGAGLYEHPSGEQKLLAATVSQSYPYQRIELSLRGPAFSSGTTVSVKLFRDYVANQYPLGPAITTREMLREYLFQDNPEGIANGELVSNAKSVYAVSRGKAYPFIAPEVVESFGYHWEFVQPKNSDLISRLSAGEKMNFAAAHPDGTLFRTKDGAFFMVWQQQRLPIIDQDIIADVWPTYYWVDVAAEQSTSVGECQQTINHAGRFSCTFRDVASSGIGNSYVFVFDPGAQKIDFGQTTLKTRTTGDTLFLKYSLGQIKNNLALRYAGQFPF